MDYSWTYYIVGYLDVNGKLKTSVDWLGMAQSTHSLTMERS